MTPRDQGDISSRTHARRAIEHLQAAGFEELAERVQRRIQRQAQQRKRAAKRAEAAASREPAPGSQADGDGRERQTDSVPSDQPLQVMLELKVVEIERDRLRALGIDFHVANGDTAPALIQAQGKLAGPNGIASRILERDDVLLSLIGALCESGSAKVLAEPTLVTVAGRPASFHSGGEFPVPIPQSDGQNGTEFREFGTRVDLEPSLLDDGRLRLQLRVTVSEIDAARSMTVGQQTVPGLRTRCINTAVELQAGQTLLLGGMVQDRTVTTGDVAKAPKQDTEQVELLLLATPSLVDSRDVPAPPY